MPVLTIGGRGQFVPARALQKDLGRHTVARLQVVYEALIAPHLAFANIKFPKERDLVFVGMHSGLPETTKKTGARNSRPGL